MITANLFFNRIPNWNAWRISVLLPLLAKHRIQEQGYDVDSKPLKAYVNHGRWCAKCECGGSEYVWEEGWFMCCGCLNSKHKHKYRQVVFPSNRKKLEMILMMRPILNRNWFPGESLDILKQENEAHRAELLEVR